MIWAFVVWIALLCIAKACGAFEDRSEWRSRRRRTSAAATMIDMQPIKENPT